MFDSIKICGENISKLSFDRFKNENIKDIFSLSPMSYQESKGNEYFSIKMQTYTYMLWARYTIDTTFFSDEQSKQFEVFAQHTLWE
ncbi:hypothetical protein SAMN02910327_00849 [Peptostreptococcaceae bacterium pGA-8]|nr:hypothetical protein SAMN02910327_00849 [Peptostreptococcaceae bacterium pGA-8]